jgi:hypothetical protein
LFELRVGNSYGVENGIDPRGGTCRRDSIAQVRCAVFDKRLIGSEILSQAFFGASDHAKRLAALREFRRQCLPNGSCGSEECVLNVCHDFYSMKVLFLPGILDPLSSKISHTNRRELPYGA